MSDMAMEPDEECPAPHKPKGFDGFMKKKKSVSAKKSESYKQIMLSHKEKK
jgi:hypothetical protein